jgi:exopolyphosphatase/guanosine-5'-triphosphate,3'-diphosphate pyrophosphatase
VRAATVSLWWRDATSLGRARDGGERQVSGAATSPIIPRWEWRTFGAPFATAEEVLQGSTPGAVEESEELYFLSEGGDNVKVRDDLLDVKVLRETGHHGLERWEPVLKAGFPLDEAAIIHLFDALRQPVPPLDRPSYSLHLLLTELLPANAAILVVPVHKRRVRYTVAGCMSELSEIESAGRQTRTLAVEAEDPAAVAAVVDSFGLGDRINTSVPRGLAALVRDEPSRYAVIDVGTNSIKFHIAEQTDDGTWRRVVDRAEVTRLGDGLDQSGAISPAALDRTVTAIARMVDEARRHNVWEIVAVGTAGLRSADNRDAVVTAIEEATGVSVLPISGDEESRLAYLAVRAELAVPDGTLVVFDTGGGSSQFTFGHGADVDDRFSVDVGAVRYTERFGLADVVASETLEAVFDAIATDLHRLDGRPAPDVLVGMGGAITNLTAVKLGLDRYQPDAVQGAILERTDIDGQIEQYRARDADGRRAIVGLQPKRADVILAGACIVRTVMDKLGQDRLIVSDRGLRHGLLVEHFGTSTGSGSGGADAR